MCWKCGLDQHAFDLVTEAEEARRQKLAAELPGRLGRLGIVGAYGKKTPRLELEAEQARLFPKL
jgi:hypothetical protein